MSNFPRQKLIRRGFIISKEYEDLAAQGKARVKLTDKQPQIDTKPLQVIFQFTGEDKYYSMPKIGDQVAVLMDEQNQDGFILGSVYTLKNNPSANSELHFVEFSDGTKIQYDKREKELTIECAGNIVVKSDDNITIESQENITLKSENNIIFDAKCKIISIERDECD